MGGGVVARGGRKSACIVCIFKFLTRSIPVKRVCVCVHAQEAQAIAIQQIIPLVRPNEHVMHAGNMLLDA